MHTFLSAAVPCPIDPMLPAIAASLEESPRLVLAAPPGAGKTTRVPPALLDAPWRGDGSILMLEPRRLAARAAARHMARLLGERPGQRVGYAMRLERCQSAVTRILVVTEGVLTRMLQQDPELTGVACVIFDEFHERSLHADTGLALCLECQEAFRPDLRLLVMSATLDTEAVAALLGALPLMRGWGMGAELRRPLGVTMVGGLIVSQVLTLFTTPVIYIWFARLAEKLGRRGGEAGHEQA